VGFYERYELLELDRDDGVKTFQAHEIPTGRPVKVHLFSAPRAPYQAQLLKKIEQLPATERSRILDRGNHLGTRYVVTDGLADYKGLFEWVTESLKPPGARRRATEMRANDPRIDARPRAGNVPGNAIDQGPPSANAPVTFVLPPRPGVPPVNEPEPSDAAPPGEKDLNREFADLFKTAERPVFVMPPDSEPRAPASRRGSSQHNVTTPVPAGHARAGRPEASRVPAVARKIHLLFFVGLLALMIAALWIGMLLARRHG
jgi:hypothetical protein